jgi:hypothetical protein
LVSWGWYSEYKRAQKLEDIRPSANIVLRYEGRLAWLVIENRGEHKAEFSVRVIQLSGTDKGQLSYYAKWRDVRDSPGHMMMAGAQYELDIASTEGRDNGLEGLNIFSAFETKSVKIPLGGEQKLIVQILSEPKLKQKCQKTYIIRLGKDSNWSEFIEVKPL